MALEQIRSGREPRGLLLILATALCLTATLVGTSVAAPRAAEAAEPARITVDTGAHLGNGFVEGFGFPVNSPVTITRNLTSIDGGSVTTDGYGWFWFDLPEGVVIQPGDTVSVTVGYVTKSTVVTGLRITGVAGSLVTGVAETSSVRTWVGESDPWVMRLESVLGGAWSTDFTKVGTDPGEQVTITLGPGDGISAEELDDDGDGTQADWVIPNPIVNADLSNNNVGGWEFGGPVTVTIHDPGTGRTETWSWAEIEDSGDGFGLYLDPYSETKPWTLLPGHQITVTGLNGTKVLIVADLAVTSFSVEDNTIAGTSNQDGRVQVEAWHPDAYGWVMVSPGSEPQHAWAADLDDANPPYDIRVLDQARISQQDADNDQTAIDLTLGPPRFVFGPLLQQIVGSDWPDGATVTLTIDRPSTHGSPDYSATTTAGPLCNGPSDCPTWQLPVTGSPNVFFDLVGGPFLARTGDIITMSDGTTTKTLTVPDLAVNTGDPATDTVSGTTTWPWPEFAFLTVQAAPWWETDVAHEVVPDSTGAWEVSFAGEWDINPGGSSAVMTDLDGDQTAVNSLAPELFVNPMADRVWAANLAPGTATLIIERPAGTVVHTQAEGTVNVLTRGSWNLDMWAQPVGDLEWPMMALFDLGTFDLLAGDVVTVTQGATTLSSTVALLTVEGVSAETDTIFGTAGADVSLHLGEGEGGYWGYFVSPDAEGHWSYYFEPGVFPNPPNGLEPGMIVQAMIGNTFVQVTVATPQTIVFDPLATMTLGDPAVALHATASSGLPVTFESTTPSVCRILNRKVAKVSAVGLGECEVVASQAGDGTYAPASTVHSFMVRAATDVSIVNAKALSRISSAVGEGYEVIVQVTAVAPGSGVPEGSVTISDGTDTCTAELVNGVGACSLTSTTAGSKTITASYPGSAQYGPDAGTARHRVVR